MPVFTLDDLTRLLREGVGVDDGVDLDGDIMSTPFTDIGYDSLALLEVAVLVEQEFGVAIPDEEIAELTTPRLTIDYVNERLAGA
ncbi:phosphopantetheine-binding protein [Nocardiopsis sp. RSe5-2]|uniref:Phosphopantetheine-binding protein n=1 Tax=Nocardiopsis endophytica TaxID=3018445 RepID=A0ABT4U8E5_9ACTN|nr:phosphopantetheine-binding protein [Nocardiopsis endophytica]MDA2812991.1 phosphopantetheine-binding protein [Nocardiopsis endophytica]